jgi:uncharacterized Zn finger protein
MACGVCGGTTNRAAVYKARDENDKRLVGLPAIECQTCGAIEPDTHKMASIPEMEISSSVRIRCAKIRDGG